MCRSLHIGGGCPIIPGLSYPAAQIVQPRNITFQIALTVQVQMASSSSSMRKSTKRRRIVPLIESKISILDRLKGGTYHVKLIDEFGTGTSTIGDIKKDEARI